jgi:hypothetical protein
MKRFLGVLAGVALGLVVCLPRGAAQSASAPPQCAESVGFRTGPSWRFEPQWDLAHALMLGVHPLMAFLPPECFVKAPCGPSGLAPVCLGAEPGTIATPACNGNVIYGVGMNVDEGLYGTVVFTGPETAGAAPEPTCPHLVRLISLRPAVRPVLEPPAVLTNLERLLQAEQLLKCGEELCRAGQFCVAVNCFEMVHRLVPGTNLEARAGEATQLMLAKVYGTATEPGIVDEPCEPGPDPLLSPKGAECSKCPECSKAACKSAGECAAAAARTVVYSVADLLGKGKETRQEDLDELMDVVASTVEPKSWTQNGGDGRIECYYRSRAIVVRQTPAVHEQIAELLAGLREARVQSQDLEAKPRHTPSADRAVKTSAAKECCKECCPACQHHDTAEAVDPGCCEECCPVLTLPVKAPCGNVEAELELLIEGCTDQALTEACTPGFHCTVGGACAEAAPSAEGLRLRWQIPLGPLMAVVHYEHRRITIGVGVTAGKETAAEECEAPR